MVPVPTTAAAAVTPASRDPPDSMVTYFSIVGILFILTVLLGIINVLIWYFDKNRAKMKLWQLKRDCRRFHKEEVDNRQHWSMTMSKKKKKKSLKQKPRKDKAVPPPTCMVDHVPF